MFTSLGLVQLGLKGSLPETIHLAQKYGYEGVDLNIAEVAQLVEQQGLESVKAMFTQANVRPALSGLPKPWSRSDEEQQELLKLLPQMATLARNIGLDRFSTGVSPQSDVRPYEENFNFHAERLRPVAEILRDHGIRLAIEFIAPKTLRQGHKYEFIYTIDGVLQLADAVGTGNIGLLLDAWHWYTSHGTMADIEKLSNDQVVAVHINDAPAGIPIDEQIDRVRMLPMETGVIDLVGFLKELKRMNYDGPVTVEPFSQKVMAMTPDAAAAAAKASIDKAWQAAGLS